MSHPTVLPDQIQRYHLVTRAHSQLIQQGAQYAALRVRWFETYCHDMTPDDYFDQWIHFLYTGKMQAQIDNNPLKPEEN